MDLLHLQRGTFQKLNEGRSLSAKALTASLFSSHPSSGGRHLEDQWSLDSNKSQIHVKSTCTSVNTRQHAQYLPLHPLFFFLFSFSLGDHVQEACSVSESYLRSTCRMRLHFLLPHASRCLHRYFNHAVAFNSLIGEHLPR